LGADCSGVEHTILNTVNRDVKTGRDADSDHNSSGIPLASSALGMQEAGRKW
jgi:hypothetical protein